MVDFLISLQLLVDDAFDAAHVPNDSGLCLVHFFFSLLLGLQVPEAIVLEGVPDKLNVTVSQLKVIAIVRRQLRPHLDWVLVYSEN